jgi:Cytochrome c554 and c-prime
MDEQTNVGPDSATPPGKKPGSARGTAFKVAALLLATLCLVIGAACWLHNGETPSVPPPEQKPPVDEGLGLYYNWPKPLFTVVLSAQEHGYLSPCGCSDPQYGGLERRYNFIQALRLPAGKGGRGWPVVAYDLGDIPQIEGPAKLANVQGLIKYRYSMYALKLMGYSAVSFGEYEAAQPLSFAIDEYALNDDRPAVLAANLLDKDKHFKYVPADDHDKSHQGPEWGKSYVGSWNETRVGDIKVSALGIIGTHDAKAVAALVAADQVPKGAMIPPAVGEQITAADPKIKFAKADKAIPVGMAAMKAGNPDFRVLLYQGPVELAKLIPLAVPDFNVIVCLDQDEPPAKADIVKTAKGETFIIRLGHKGKNMGVVGVFPPKKLGGEFELKYQLVPISPVYKTLPADKPSQPILKVMESYTKELKDEDYLGKYGKVPHANQAAIKGNPAWAALNASGYAGSQVCNKCHAPAFKIWKNSDHAKAYGTLVDAKDNPPLREYDPECIVCHTVGFRFQDGFANAKATPNLKDVGCESCHGPCEIHVKNPNNASLYPLINKWKAPLDETNKQKDDRQLKIQGMCMECHDHDNDVTWKAFAPKWAKIVHMNE